jgi:hypothetical protein
MTTEISTFTLDDEMPQRGRFHGREDYFDDISFLILAESEGYDIMMWDIMYIFQGGPSRPRSQWLGDGVANVALQVIIPQERRHKGMYNNNFHRMGMSIPQYYRHEDLKVVRENNRVMWSVGDIHYICRPPVWELKGKHGEAEYDLTFHQLPSSSVAWVLGTFEEAEKTRMGAGYCYVSCQGTLKVAGQTYPIKDGLGVHERIAYSECRVFDLAVGPAMQDTGQGGGIAIMCFTPDIQVWIYATDPDAATAFLNVKGKEITYLPKSGKGTTSYVITERWFDPRTWLYIPSRFHITCASSEGVLDLDFQGEGRCVYPWELKRGYDLLVWVLATANGAFYYPDGRKITIKDALAYQETIKNIIVHNETMAGPDLRRSW